jgi:hypothetical protein
MNVRKPIGEMPYRQRFAGQSVLERRRESKCWQAIIALLQVLLLQPGGHYSVALAGLLAALVTVTG